MIHESAIIHPDSKIGKDVTIAPFAIIEENVEIHDSVEIAAHAIIRSGSRIGKNSRIDSHAVIGGLPQDLSFDANTKTYAIIGEDCIIREGATVNRATQENEATKLGNNVLLMAYAHVGHDCEVESNAILANNVMLGGFSSIGSYAFLGGGAMVHQFNRVGGGAMISGGCRVSEDIPPYCLAAERSELSGLNLIGLRRRNFSREIILEIKKLFRYVLSEGNVKEKAKEMLQIAESEEARYFLEFIKKGKRQIARYKK